MAPEGPLKVVTWYPGSILAPQHELVCIQEPAQLSRGKPGTIPVDDIGIIEEAFLQTDHKELGFGKMVLQHIANVLSMTQIQSCIHLNRTEDKSMLETCKTYPT